MTAALLKGSLLGGLVLFLWSYIAWAVLPLHTRTMDGFTNPDAVIQALTANAPRSGVYTIPAETTATSEQAKAAQDAMANGPMVFLSLRLGKMEPMPLLIGIQFLTQCVAAFLATLLLLKTSLPYWHRVAFLLAIALIVAFAGHVPNWTWFSFSAAYTLSQFTDLLIGWFLAGMVIAKFAR